MRTRRWPSPSQVSVKARGRSVDVCLIRSQLLWPQLQRQAHRPFLQKDWAPLLPLVVLGRGQLRTLSPSVTVLGPLSINGLQNHFTVLYNPVMKPSFSHEPLLSKLDISRAHLPGAVKAVVPNVGFPREAPSFEFPPSCGLSSQDGFTTGLRLGLSYLLQCSHPLVCPA